jgi:hypothetical protein
MKNQLLLPRSCRLIGLITFPFALALFIAVYEFNFLSPLLATHMRQPEGMAGFLNGNNNLTDEVAITGVIVSLFMIAFSKLRHEDEYILAIRLRSLQIGVYANYGVFVLLTFLVYNGSYLSVLFYNSATILILFILVFNFNLYVKPRLTKSADA